MKIREGFVSNSSSSAFILAIPQAVQSLEELQKFLFGDVVDIRYPYCNEGETPLYLSARGLAEALFSHTIAGLPATVERIADELECIGFPETPEEKQHTRYVALQKAQQFIQKQPHANIYVLEVGDAHGTINGTVGSTLEEEVLPRLPHIRISHH